MSADAWLVLGRTDRVVHWQERGRDELLDARGGAAAFVADCARYLRDARKQAQLDLPRMSVTLNGYLITSIEALELLAHPDQLALLYTLCNQVVFGQAYECAATSLPARYVVCEHNPGRAAHVRLESDARAPPFRVHSLRARKRMRAVDVDHLRRAPLEVVLRVDLSLRHDRVVVGASRWPTI